MMIFDKMFHRVLTWGEKSNNISFREQKHIRFYPVCILIIIERKGSIGLADKQKVQYREFILDQIKLGGWGGIAQIAISFVVCVLFFFVYESPESFLWSFLVLITPLTIDCLSFLSKIPRELPSAKFRNLHWIVSSVLLFLVISGIITFVVLAKVSGSDRNGFMIIWVQWILRPLSSFSVFGGIVNYCCEILRDSAHSGGKGSDDNTPPRETDSKG